MCFMTSLRKWSIGESIHFTLSMLTAFKTLLVQSSLFVVDDRLNFVCFCTCSVDEHHAQRTPQQFQRSIRRRPNNNLLLPDRLQQSKTWKKTTWSKACSPCSPSPASCYTSAFHGCVNNQHSHRQSDDKPTEIKQPARLVDKQPR